MKGERSLYPEREGWSPQGAVYGGHTFSVDGIDGIERLTTSQIIGRLAEDDGTMWPYPVPLERSEYLSRQGSWLGKMYGNGSSFRKLNPIKK